MQDGYARLFERAQDRLGRSLKRFWQFRGVLAARSGHARSSTTATANRRRRGSHDLHGVQPALFQRLVEVTDQMHSPVLDRADHYRGGRILVLELIGDGEQAVRVDALDLGDNDLDSVSLLFAEGSDLGPGAV